MIINFGVKQVFYAVLFYTACNLFWSREANPLLQAVWRTDEICDNALDDDSDGLTDLNDSNCICKEARPVSLIPNPSFEEKNCCPEDRSQLDCAKTWIQASEATTDYLHTCGWMGWMALPPPVPFPDGNAVVGFRNGRYASNKVPNWKEYAGACLNAPMKPGTTYLIRFYIGFTRPENSPPLEIVFYEVWFSRIKIFCPVPPRDGMVQFMASQHPPTSIPMPEPS